MRSVESANSDGGLGEVSNSEPTERGVADPFRTAFERLGRKIADRDRMGHGSANTTDSQEDGHKHLSGTTRAQTSARSQALPELDSAPFYVGQITNETFTQGQDPTVIHGPYGLPQVLERYLSERDLSLYSHQVEVLNALRSETNVVLSTQTASGKSLAFNLPTFERLLVDPDATALFLYPTKALANDQLDGLIEFDEALGGTVHPATYDGDTPTAQRQEIRQRSRLIISNPHALHLYLGWPEGWKQFLSRLAFVVIDESHYYSGTLGGHVALLLRRLRRLCSSLGAQPLFLAASGTIANPAAHAQDLVGLPFHLIDRDGSRRSPKWTVTWDATKDPSNSLQTQSALLTRHLLRCRRNVIVFSDSRAKAEAIARQASDRSNRVLSYRAGYPSATRRQIEADLRDGRVRGISSTSALEIGIDIGSLDTVILSGYPGSLSATLQRAGRAGRSGGVAVTVLMLGDDPVSRYLAQHSEEFFTRAPESAIVNVDNEEILLAHLRCASAELPLREDELATIFGASARTVALRLLESGQLFVDESGEYRSSTKVPHRSIQFIAQASRGYVVKFPGARGHHGHSETLSADQALREAHVKAVFTHQGTPYRVTSIDHERREIQTKPEPERSFTVAQLFRSVSKGEYYQRRIIREGVELSAASYRIVEQIVGYREFSPTERGQTVHKVSSPASSYQSAGLALSFDSDLSVGVDLTSDSAYEALHALEHAMLKSLPLLALATPRDFSGLTIKGEGSPTLLLYERAHGGSGLTRLLYGRFDDLLNLTRDLITSCRCVDGCPLCILDPSCRDEELSKPGAVLAASSLSTNGANAFR